MISFRQVLVLGCPVISLVLGLPVPLENESNAERLPATQIIQPRTFSPASSDNLPEPNPNGGGNLPPLSSIFGNGQPPPMANDRLPAMRPYLPPPIPNTGRSGPPPPFDAFLHSTHPGSGITKRPITPSVSSGFERMNIGNEGNHASGSGQPQGGARVLDVMPPKPKRIRPHKFPCTYAESGCNRMFTQNADVLRHVSNIHELDESKKVPCSHAGCNYKTARTDNLRAHEKLPHPS
jgi:hypothetical protein